MSVNRGVTTSCYFSFSRLLDLRADPNYCFEVKKSRQKLLRHVPIAVLERSSPRKPKPSALMLGNVSMYVAPDKAVDLNAEMKNVDGAFFFWLSSHSVRAACVAWVLRIELP